MNKINVDDKYVFLMAMGGGGCRGEGRVCMSIIA